MSVKQDNVKFEEAIEIAGYGKFSMFIIFLSGMTVCCSLLSTMDVSFLLPVAECDLQLTSLDKGLLGSASFIGIMCASHLSGFLADTLGRRYILLRCLAFNVFTYVFGSIAPNFWTFFALRVINGMLTSPCIIAVFPFLGEYVPAKRRYQAMLVMCSLSSMALLYASLVGWALLQSEWHVDLVLVEFTPWRLFYLLMGMPSLLSSLLFYLTPESPKFLLTRGKKGDTLKVLQRVHSINSGTDPNTFPVQSVVIDKNEVIPPAREKGVAGVFKQVGEQILPLCRPPYFKDLFVCIIILFTSLLCVNSVSVWLPEVINRIANYKEAHPGHHLLCTMMSRHSFMQYTNYSGMATATELCDSTINPAVFVPNVILAAVLPASMFATSYIVTCVDARILLILNILLTGAMAFCVMQVLDASLIVVIFGGIPVFMSICFNIVSSAMVEIFPTYIRATAVSMAIVCGRLGSITGSYLFSELLDSHCSLLFQLLSGICFCTAVAPLCLKLKKPKAKETAKEEVFVINGKN